MITLLLMVTFMVGGPVVGPTFVFDTEEKCQLAADNFSIDFAEVSASTPDVKGVLTQCVVLDKSKITVNESAKMDEYL